MGKKILLAVLLLVVSCGIHSQENSFTYDDIDHINKQLNNSLVYISEQIRHDILLLHSLFFDHNWSPLFRTLYLDLQEDATIALYEQVDQIVEECLAALSLHNDVSEMRADFQEYQALLHAGQMHISAIADMQTDPAIKIVGA